MFKNRIMQIVMGSLLATALWQAPASAEEKAKDEAKHEHKAKEEKSATGKTGRPRRRAAEGRKVGQLSLRTSAAQLN
jgi:hypothetical protein